MGDAKVRKEVWQPSVMGKLLTAKVSTASSCEFALCSQPTQARAKFP